MNAHTKLTPHIVAAPVGLSEPDYIKRLCDDLAEHVSAIDALDERIATTLRSFEQ